MENQSTENLLPNTRQNLCKWNLFHIIRYFLSCKWSKKWIRNRKSIFIVLFLLLISLFFSIFLFHWKCEHKISSKCHCVYSHVNNISTSKPLMGPLKRRLPQCIIIGVRKAGTRALLEFLALHPDVRKADAEVHFFDSKTMYQLGLDFYRRSMPFSYAHQITIEKTPAYFITQEAPERIFRMNSSIKLILIVREPVERLISDFAQLRLNRLQKLRIQQNPLDPDLLPIDYLKDYQFTSINGTNSFSKISVLPRFEQLVLNSNGQVNIHYKPIKTSIYSLHLKKWLQIFPREQIHLVDGDQLIHDPYIEIRKLEYFLGLRPQIRREHFVYNPRKAFFCIRSSILSPLFNGSYTKQKSMRCLNSSKGRKHPQVSNEHDWT